MKTFFYFLIGVTVLSCTPTHFSYIGSKAGRQLGIVDNYKINRIRHVVLPADVSLYVPMTHNFKGSLISYKITQYLSASLSPKFRRVTKGHALESYDEALRSARRHHADFLIYATLTEWEDNVNSREEYDRHEDLVNIGLDRIGLKFLTIDSRSEHVVDMTNLTAKSGFVTLYGDEPDHLLEKPLHKYANLISASVKH